jgi:hypothetical protein
MPRISTTSTAADAMKTRPAARLGDDAGSRTAGPYLVVRP